MNSTADELKIPILTNNGSPQVRRGCLYFRAPSKRLGLKDFIVNLCVGVFYFCLLPSAVFFALFLLGYLIGGKVFDKPEIRVDSVFVCPANTSSNNNLVIWDLKIGITNTDNHSLCIPRFEVSVFSYNRTNLLTKAAVTLTQTCVGSRSHTSALGLVEASSVQIQTNGTIRLDLKFHGQFDFRYHGDLHTYAGDVVCKDAKVAFSPSRGLSCGSMVGDPFLCSYESYKMGL